MRGVCRAVAIFGMAGWLAAAAWAEQVEPFLSPARPSTPPVVSSSQRFVFRGLRSEDGLKLSSWCEKVVGRLEAELGIPLPFARSEMIRISGRTQEGAEQGSIELSQGYIDRLLQQRIVLVNPEFIEEEMLHEALVAVLLYRYALGGNPVTTPIVIPDWFTTGIAQRIQPELRERNLRYISGAWKEGKGFRAAEILALVNLPPGRVPEKAYCGLLVEWLEEPIRNEMTWRRFFDHLIQGGSLDIAFLQGGLLPYEDAVSVEKAWDVWMAREMDGLREWGTVKFDDVIELKQILIRATAGYPPGRRAGGLELADLIVLRDEPWMLRLVTEAQADLMTFMVGRAPSLRATSEAYLQFIQALGEPNHLNPTFRFTLGGEEVVLRRLLKEAEESMTQLEKEVALRSHYFDQVESSEATPPAEPADPVHAATPPPRAEAGASPEPAPASLDRQRSSYLDALEEERTW